MVSTNYKKYVETPHYMGLFVQQRARTSNILAESESYGLRNKVDKHDREIKEDTHALITRNQFEYVQSLMSQKVK